MTDEKLNEVIEQAYWQFDAMRKGYAAWTGMPKSERDAFKQTLRGVVIIAKRDEN